MGAHGVRTIPILLKMLSVTLLPGNPVMTSAPSTMRVDRSSSEAA